MVKAIVFCLRTLLCIHAYINEQYITQDQRNYVNIFVCILMPKAQQMFCIHSFNCCVQGITAEGSQRKRMRI